MTANPGSEGLWPLSATKAAIEKTRQKRGENDVYYDAWVPCPSSFSPHVPAHFVQVKKRKRRSATCRMCGARMHLESQFWRNGEVPIHGLTQEDAKQAMAAIQEFKAQLYGAKALAMRGPVPEQAEQAKEIKG